ncbi:MAG: hypothetical protein WCK16_02655 [Candidatus Moraniibacteriota bacterium]
MEQKKVMSIENLTSVKSPEFKFFPAFTGPYGRVAEMAYRALADDATAQKGWGNPSETFKKIAEKLNDVDFKVMVQAIWDKQTVAGHVQDDPAEQEKLWARGLIERIKEEPFFNQ